MQAKWIKLDLALYDVTYSKEMVASKKFCTPLYSPVRLLLIYHFYELNIVRQMSSILLNVRLNQVSAM